MSEIAGVVRPFWLKGLNEVSGQVNGSLGDWFQFGDYQVYSEIEIDSFSLSCSTPVPVLNAFAFDCSRMAMASFESVYTTVDVGKLPKATAWTFIHLYYSSFFAAHSILRMLGISCTQVASPHSRRIEEIAGIFGMRNEKRIGRGSYACRFDTDGKILVCEKVNSSSGGIHEAFWRLFNEEMEKLSKEILQSDYSDETKLAVFGKFNDLKLSLNQSGAPGGSWLSHIRNEINYRHGLGTWYPYTDHKSYYRFLKNLNKWHSDPLELDVSPREGRPLETFRNVATFLIALCRALAQDMSERCPEGRSFHYYNSLALLRLL